jgi:hypothetical protein
VIRAAIEVKTQTESQISRGIAATSELEVRLVCFDYYPGCCKIKKQPYFDGMNLQIIEH